MKTLPLKFPHPDPCRNKTHRQILLIEPYYRNKYPPLGLMKLSTYHKHLGDYVTFYKGKPSVYFFEEKVSACLEKLRLQNFEIDDWETFTQAVRKYLKLRRLSALEKVLTLVPDNVVNITQNLLSYYANRYRPQRKWDRVYVTTLFTFYWKETIEAITLAKQVIKSIDSLYVGGVAATLIPEMFAEETELLLGHNIITGLIDKAGILDDNEYVIDTLTPDYSILDTIEYTYPLNTGYLCYTTKGCPNHCKFCAVPTLEPEYKDRIPLKQQISSISHDYGERKDLILMDNNVLASCEFPRIIEEILELGFTKEAKYVEPNSFEILLSYLYNEHNPSNQRIYEKKICHFLQDFGQRRIKRIEVQQEYYALLAKYQLTSPHTVKKSALQKARKQINVFIEKYCNKIEKARYVDFNQGLDCRYIDEEKMKLLGQIPIRPMRIAFDSLAVREQYENAVKLAVKYGITRLSNYILFNYTHDEPADLWKRLKINISLNKRLGIEIYSFPMRFIPLSGPQSITRSLYIGTHWNPKYLRAVQCILNATRGVVSVNPPFFERAFGKTQEAYKLLLLRPEPYILYRDHFEENGKAAEWEEQWGNLNRSERHEAKELILTNSFTSLNGTSSVAVREFMKHYQVKKKIKV
jgi:hypothetical protein